MEIEQVFGFNFSGPDNKHALVRTYVQCQNLDLDTLLSLAKDYASNLDWKPKFATLKKFTYLGDKSFPSGNAPEKAGREKLQAYVFTSKGQCVDNNAGIVTVDGEELSLNFSSYEVHIIEL